LHRVNLRFQGNTEVTLILNIVIILLRDLASNDFGHAPREIASLGGELRVLQKVNVDLRCSDASVTTEVSLAKKVATRLRQLRRTAGTRGQSDNDRPTPMSSSHNDGTEEFLPISVRENHLASAPVCRKRFALPHYPFESIADESKCAVQIYLSGWCQRWPKFRAHPSNARAPAHLRGTIHTQLVVELTTANRLGERVD
jgi:hypothetical protein